MFFNYSLEETPEVSKEWQSKDPIARKELIEGFLKEQTRFEGVVVVDCKSNGHVDIRMIQNISVSKRGFFLLELEEELKRNIDQGLTIWCEPIGDKNSLRNLRGIQMK